MTKFLFGSFAGCGVVSNLHSLQSEREGPDQHRREKKSSKQTQQNGGNNESME
jgi:hypothetical protein